MRPLRVEEDRIVFEAVIRKGVQITTKAQVKLTESICRRTGRTLVAIRGNFREVQFIIRPPFSEEEVEAL